MNRYYSTELRQAISLPLHQATGSEREMATDRLDIHLKIGRSFSENAFVQRKGGVHGSVDLADGNDRRRRPCYLADTILL